MRRKKNSFRQREFKKRVLICCEGLTEKNYFHLLKEDLKVGKTVRVTVLQSGNSDCQGVVREAVKRNNDDIDRVFVVFDHDNQSHRDSAFQLAERHNFKIIFSSICFEYWYLLHFRYTTRAYSTESTLEADLVRCENMENYEKNDTKHCELLKDKLPIAMEHAKRLKGYHVENNPNTPIYNLNPYTNVDELISFLISQSNG